LSKFKITPQRIGEKVSEVSSEVDEIISGGGIGFGGRTGGSHHKRRVTAYWDGWKITSSR